MNPLWQQRKLNEFCKKNDILLTGYSPLGGYNTQWGHNRVMECDVIQDIAKSRGKTPAQVIFLCLLFYLQFLQHAKLCKTGLDSKNILI